jgi:hypothetical protein
MSTLLNWFNKKIPYAVKFYFIPPVPLSVSNVGVLKRIYFTIITQVIITSLLTAYFVIQTIQTSDIGPYDPTAASNVQIGETIIESNYYDGVLAVNYSASITTSISVRTISDCSTVSNYYTNLELYNYAQIAFNTLKFYYDDGVISINSNIPTYYINFTNICTLYGFSSTIDDTLGSWLIYQYYTLTDPILDIGCGGNAYPNIPGSWLVLNNLYDSTTEPMSSFIFMFATNNLSNVINDTCISYVNSQPNVFLRIHNVPNDGLTIASQVISISLSTIGLFFLMFTGVYPSTTVHKKTPDDVNNEIWEDVQKCEEKYYEEHQGKITPILSPKNTPPLSHRIIPQTTSNTDVELSTHFDQ